MSPYIAASARIIGQSRAPGAWVGRAGEDVDRYAGAKKLPDADALVPQLESHDAATGVVEGGAVRGGCRRVHSAARVAVDQVVAVVLAGGTCHEPARRHVAPGGGVQGHCVAARALVRCFHYVDLAVPRPMDGTRTVVSIIGPLVDITVEP